MRDPLLVVAVGACRHRMRLTVLALAPDSVARPASFLSLFTALSLVFTPTPAASLARVKPLAVRFDPATEKQVNNPTVRFDPATETSKLTILLGEA